MTITDNINEYILVFILNLITLEKKIVCVMHFNRDEESSINFRLNGVIGDMYGERYKLILIVSLI